MDVTPGSACKGDCEAWVRNFNETTRKSFGAHQRYAALYRGMGNLGFACVPAIIVLCVLTTEPDHFWGSLIGSVIYAVPLVIGGIFFRRWASWLDPK